MNVRFRLIMFAFCLAGGLYPVPPIGSQSTAPPQPLPSHPKNSFANAPNRWQLTAIDPRTQVDTVNPSVRAQRNAYWKSTLQAFLSSVGANYSFSEPAFWGDAPEFPAVKGAVWAIATFESFHVFAIDPDAQLIYTEMNFRVEQVFRQPAGSSVSSGSVIDYDTGGGRIKMPNGEVKSLLVWPRHYFVQLGHKYLILFVYQPGGDLFRAEKDWDISSGKVVPDDALEVYEAAHKTSLIDGMSLEELINYLPSMLPDESK